MAQGNPLVLPTHSPPARRLETATSIYIAWGDDRLGPYTPAQVTQLVECGCLFPDDYAAVDGDDTWVPLARFLAVEDTREHTADAPAAPAAGRPWWPRFLAAFLTLVLLALALLAFGLPRMTVRIDARNAAKPKTLPPLPMPVLRVTVPEMRDLPEPEPPAPAPPPPPPAQETGGRLSGSVALTAKDAPRTPLESVTVRVYPLKDLEPYLARKKAAAQVEIARLAPLIEAADAEKNARVAAAESARQAFLGTDPSDALYPSLEFAYRQAKGTIKTVDDDCRYYRSLRGDVTNAEFYLRDLPAPLVRTETDARGEFTFELPSGGPFAVVANAPQGTVTGSRTRCWMTKVSFADGNPQTLAFSEGNTTSANGAGSLIQTED